MDQPVIESFIWQPERECMEAGERRAFQLERLRRQVAHVAHVPFYAKKFAEAGITPESIRSLGDVRRLPFTTKQDLRDHYPGGFVAVPRDRIVRYHGSSGTTGKPTFVAYTRNDLDLWRNCVARFLAACGTKPGQAVQVSFGYGLFTGGFGLHYGLETLGAAVIPVSSGNTDKQLMIMQDMETEGLICTPSYAARLMEVIAGRGLRDSIRLKFAQLGGEPWTEDMRRTLEAGLGFPCFNNYGLSEVLGPGVSGECAWRTGMHIQEDHFLVEVINPDTLQPVPDGQEGELVFTALTKEAFPLLRYRTRDIASITRETCPCGRTTARMTRVVGRTDDMLIIRGVNVYPSQIEEALLRIEGVAPHYTIELDRPGALDEVTVHIEMRPEFFSDSMSKMQELKERIFRAIQSVTGLSMEINLVSPQTIQRFEGKAARVVDHRKLRD